MFTCSKVINAFKRQNSWTDTFRKNSNLLFPKLPSQNIRDFNHATILSPSFHGLHEERLAQWPAFCDPQNGPKIPGDTSRKIGWGVQHASWNPYPISDQNLWFSLPYFRPDQKFDTLFQTWSPARRVTGAHEKLLRHVHSSWLVLSPNDEEVTNSSRKHTQFKTRRHKPYPVSDQNG